MNNKLYFLFLAILYISKTNARIQKNLLPVDRLRYDFLTLEEYLWDFSESVSKESGRRTPPEVQLISKYEKFGNRIKETLDHDITYGLETLDSVWSYQLAYADLRALYALYESFRRFQRQQTGEGRIPSPKKAWTDLAETILHDPKNNVEDAMKRIDDVIKRNMFQSALQEVQGDMLCNAKQSPQQVLYNLYNTIALTELKGYAMIQFSYMLLRMYEAGNFTKESQLVRERFESRTEKGIEMISSVMKNASRSLSMCTPRSHSPGDTYLEITEFLQGYIQNEVDLNRDGTCTKTCSDYPLTKSFGCYMNFNYACQQRRCNGNILNCKFIKSDMRVCPSRHNQYRYEYIKYSNGRVLGRDEGCQFGSTEVDSWWRWIFYHCSYCFCICDEQGPYSDRYFSLRPVIANIQNNMVVTGLRFVKRNRIIHLQIQEGQLLPDGNINSTTVHWVEPNAFKITDKKVYKGQDYHTLDISKKAVDLDDLEAEDGYVVTGVRFKLLGGHLNFEIYTTKFDFATGKLIDPSNTGWWRDNINTPEASSNKRREIKIENLDRPIRSDRPFNQISKHDQYLEFTHTGMDQDASQTTVPFIDAQPVESLQPVPLAGAGIFYKGNDKFAGFIAPKIITYDFSKHMQAAFPEPEVH